MDSVNASTNQTVSRGLPGDGVTFALSLPSSQTQDVQVYLSHTFSNFHFNPSLPALSECECGDPSESCDVGSGQCVCPPLVTGRTCDSCMENTFGDPGEGCFPCGCDDVGTDSCNSTSGECV